MTTTTTPATIHSVKGDFEGTIAECAAWLAEYQPAYATLEIEGGFWSVDDVDLQASDGAIADALVALTFTAPKC